MPTVNKATQNEKDSVAATTESLNINHHGDLNMNYALNRTTKTANNEYVNMNTVTHNNVNPTKEDKTMNYALNRTTKAAKDKALSLVNKWALKNDVCKGHQIKDFDINNKASMLFVAEALAYAKMFRNPDLKYSESEARPDVFCPYAELKDAIFRAINAEIREQFDAALWAGTDEKEVHRLFERKDEPTGWSDAYDLACELNLKVETLYVAFNNYLQPNGRRDAYDISHPVIKFWTVPNHAGRTEQYPAHTLPKNEVDIDSVVKWKMMEVATNQINTVLSKHKSWVFQAWKQLNKEIVEGEFAFNVNRREEHVPFGERTIKVNTLGYGYGIIEYYEQQIFETGHQPIVDDYGVVSEISQNEPYTNDVREVQEKLEAMLDWESRTHTQAALRDDLTPLIEVLATEYNRSRVFKEKEIRKMKQLNINEIWLWCPESMSTDVFKVKEFVKNPKTGEMVEREVSIHGRRFDDWASEDVQQFLLERAKTKGVAKAQQLEDNAAAARAKMRADMGWVLE